MVKIILFITVLFIILFSCKSQKLTIERGDYYDQSVPLRLDGFYYSKRTYIDPHDTEWIEIYFFYNNGILFNQGGVKLNKLSHDIDINPSPNGSRTSTILNWGIFNIQKKNNILEFEKWEPSSGGGAKTNIYTAEILNDTTFVINKIFSHYDNKFRTTQDTFYFMSYSLKPDSTNRFIKE